MPDPDRAPIVRRLFKQYASGAYTKQDILRKATQWGLTNRRGQPLTSQAIGMLLRNRLYIGIIDVPDFDVRDRRGDFEPLVSEEIFYKAQAVLSGRVPMVAPLLKRRPDFPLRGFVRCAACDRGLTGSWSKGRTHYYAYYHCRPACRGLNVTKEKLEGAFVDELARLQPSAGYMRLLKDTVVKVWKERQSAVHADLQSAEQARQKLQKKLDRLDEAFLFERSIDIDTYDRRARSRPRTDDLAQDRRTLLEARRNGRRRHPGVR